MNLYSQNVAKQDPAQPCMSLDIKTPPEKIFGPLNTS